MTAKKLKIIGPYTPEHPGPFCTRDGAMVRIVTKTEGSKEYPIIGYRGEDNTPTVWTEKGWYFDNEGSDPDNLMNAEEAPVAREFWVNEYDGGVSGKLHLTEASAKFWSDCSNFTRTIHVREVLPGEKEDILEWAPVSGTFGVIPSHKHHGVGLHINGDAE